VRTVNGTSAGSRGGDGGRPSMSGGKVASGENDEGEVAIGARDSTEGGQGTAKARGREENIRKWEKKRMANGLLRTEVESDTNSLCSEWQKDAAVG